LAQASIDPLDKISLLDEEGWGKEGMGAGTGTLTPHLGHFSRTISSPIPLSRKSHPEHSDESEIFCRRQVFRGE